MCPGRTTAIVIKLLLATFFSKISLLIFKTYYYKSSSLIYTCECSGKRGRVVRRSRRAHNPEIGGSNPSPAIKT